MGQMFRHMPRRKRLNLRKDRLEVLSKPFEELCPRMRIPWPGSIVAFNFRCQTGGESCTKIVWQSHTTALDELFIPCDPGRRKGKKYERHAGAGIGLVTSEERHGFRGSCERGGHRFR